MRAPFVFRGKFLRDENYQRFLSLPKVLFSGGRRESQTRKNAKRSIAPTGMMTSQTIGNLQKSVSHFINIDLVVVI